MTNFCGVAGFNGGDGSERTVPGDPDNNITMAAYPAFGGIDVIWTYPNLNPHSVAHVILYRNIVDEFYGSTKIATVAGDNYYDKLNDELTYFYWLNIVSVNGTVGATIGSASAVAELTTTQTLARLTGLITSDTLSPALRAEVFKISTIGNKMAAEIATREDNDASLSAAMNALNTELDNAVLASDEEAFARMTSTDMLIANIASVSTALNTAIENVDLEVTALGELYTAMVTPNNLVHGFGVKNTGGFIEAGFDVASLWVGTTELDKRKPFSMVNAAPVLAPEFIPQHAVTEAVSNTATGYGASASITITETDLAPGTSTTPVVCIATFYGQESSTFVAQILRDGIVIQEGVSGDSGAASAMVPITITAVDLAEVGSHVYTVRGAHTNGSLVGSSQTVLFVMETKR